MPETQLTLITVSYNSSSIIGRCLSELVLSESYRFIFIDNASTDGSAEGLKQRFPHAEVIALEQNIGYGRATNVALNQVSTPYAMLLNPDLHAEPHDIERMLQHAGQADEQVAILGPAVKEQDHTNDQPQCINWISGSAMLFNMQALKQIGFFDENIFLFSEETDLCRRAVDAGYKILKCHDVFMKHMKGQSSLPDPEVEYMKNWHFGWSHAYYYTKHKMATGKKAPARMVRNYKIKSWFATDKLKRNKYKARSEGVWAFISGTPAFRPDGTPQASP